MTASSEVPSEKLVVEIWNKSKNIKGLDTKLSILLKFKWFPPTEFLNLNRVYLEATDRCHWWLHLREYIITSIVVGS